MINPFTALFARSPEKFVETRPQTLGRHVCVDTGCFIVRTAKNDSTFSHRLPGPLPVFQL